MNEMLKIFEAGSHAEVEEKANRYADICGLKIRRAYMTVQQTVIYGDRFYLTVLFKKKKKSKPKEELQSYGDNEDNEEVLY